jgi:hypothetical protein
VEYAEVRWLHHRLFSFEPPARWLRGAVAEDVSLQPLRVNRAEPRSFLYHLAPAIPVTKTERGWEMDLGYCNIRC